MASRPLSVLAVEWMGGQEPPGRKTRWRPGKKSKMASGYEKQDDVRKPRGVWPILKKDRNKMASRVETSTPSLAVMGMGNYAAVWMGKETGVNTSSCVWRRALSVQPAATISTETTRDMLRHKPCHRQSN